MVGVVGMGLWHRKLLWGLRSAAGFSGLSVGIAGEMRWLVLQTGVQETIRGEKHDTGFENIRRNVETPAEACR
jgi:hypothetical protein